MKAFIVELKGPEDLVRLQEVLANVAKASGPSKAIPCRCKAACGKTISVDKLNGELVGVKILPGDGTRAGIILDVDGVKDLVEQLLNTVPGGKT